MVLLIVAFEEAEKRGFIGTRPRAEWVESLGMFQVKAGPVKWSTLRRRYLEWGRGVILQPKISRPERRLARESIKKRLQRIRARA